MKFAALHLGSIADRANIWVFAARCCMYTRTHTHALVVSRYGKPWHSLTCTFRLRLYHEGKHFNEIGIERKPSPCGQACYFNVKAINGLVSKKAGIGVCNRETTPTLHNTREREMVHLSPSVEIALAPTISCIHKLHPATRHNRALVKDRLTATF